MIRLGRVEALRQVQHQGADRGPGLQRLVLVATELRRVGAGGERGSERGERGFLLRDAEAGVLEDVQKVTLAPAIALVALEHATDGRSEVTLIEEEKAAGKHKVTVDGSHLASGIYTCMIFSGNDVQLAKVIKN